MFRGVYGKEPVFFSVALNPYFFMALGARGWYINLDLQLFDAPEKFQR